MRGHLEQLPSGAWRISIPLGKDPKTGKYLRSFQTVTGTKRDAERELTKMLRELDTGSYVEPSKQTVAEYLGRWLKDFVGSHIEKPRTRRNYEMIVRHHLIPALGHHRLARLTPSHVQGYYTEALAHGRVDAKGSSLGTPLAVTTVAHHHAVLHEALEHAVKWGLVGRNVADAVDAPTIQRTEMQTWTDDDVRRFLAAAEDNRYYCLFLSAILTGMRQGELLGLRWSDVDLDAGKATVRQTLERPGKTPRFGTPKNKSSRRSVVLSEILVAALRRWKAKQNEERLAFGPAYRDYGLIFTALGGAPVHASNLLARDFARMVAKAGVPTIRFHDLRHTSATLLLGAGVHPKIVSERLGHATIAITLDTYSHVLPTLQKEAAETLGRFVAGG